MGQLAVEPGNLSFCTDLPQGRGRASLQMSMPPGAVLPREAGPTLLLQYLVRGRANIPRVRERQGQLSRSLEFQLHGSYDLPVVTYSIEINKDPTCRTRDPDMALSNNLGQMTPWTQVAAQASQIIWP